MRKHETEKQIENTNRSIHNKATPPQYKLAAEQITEYELVYRKPGVFGYLPNLDLHR